MAHGARLSIAAVAERGPNCSCGCGFSGWGGGRRCGLFFLSFSAPSFSSYFEFRFREGGKEEKEQLRQQKKVFGSIGVAKILMKIVKLSMEMEIDVEAEVRHRQELRQKVLAKSPPLTRSDTPTSQSHTHV